LLRLRVGFIVLIVLHFIVVSEVTETHMVDRDEPVHGCGGSGDGVKPPIGQLLPDLRDALAEIGSQWPR